MKKVKIVIIFLLVLGISFVGGVFITYNFMNKKLVLENENTTTEVSFNSIAMMLETGSNSGEYALSTDTSWPDSSTYTFNETLSKCENGSTLSYDEDSNIVYMTGTKSDRCYIYFDYDTSSSITDLTLAYQEYGDLNTIISSSGTSYITDIWESTLTNDGYRYVGEDPDNYICFGTTDLDTCINNQDLYMYRIIGIFVDKYGSYHLKLIKKEALDTAYAWHSDVTTNTNWQDSDLYNGLNGSYFLTNTTYSYMQDSNWSDLITTWTWTAVHTRYYTSSYGLAYGNNTAETIYYHENNYTDLIVGACYYESGIVAKCSSGEWNIVNSKISLMYVSDYVLSLGDSMLSAFINENVDEFSSSWIYLENNDNDAISTYEWTIARYGQYSTGAYFASAIKGYLGIAGTNEKDSVRPVFYLNTDVVISSGTGEIISPYMLVIE